MLVMIRTHGNFMAARLKKPETAEANGTVPYKNYNNEPTTNMHDNTDI
jgi:hypothetical protein